MTSIPIYDTMAPMGISRVCWCTNEPPCKRQLTEAAAEVIELLDSNSESDNNIIIDIPTIKAETLPSMIPISSSFKKISPIPEEQIKQSKSTAAVTTTPLGFKLRIDESAKDSEGRCYDFE